MRACITDFGGVAPLFVGCLSVARHNNTHARRESTHHSCLYQGSEAFNPDRCHPKWRWGEVPSDHVLTVDSVYEATRDLDDLVHDMYRRLGELVRVVFWKCGELRGVRWSSRVRDSVSDTVSAVFESQFQCMFGSLTMR